MTLQCLSVPRFYRVQVGIQSPDAVTTIRGVLRRFNDFLKLFSDLKKAFPKKSIPSAPPKGLLRMRSRALLEERRSSLEEWMTKLLSDIDISRSAAVASFLELEAAARSSFQETDQQLPEGNHASSRTISSQQVHASSSLSTLTGSSSIMSDYGSDTVYETSELGTPSVGRDDSSEAAMEDLTLEEDLTNPIENLVKYGMSNIDEGLLMGESIMDELEGLSRHKAHASQIIDNGNVSRAGLMAVERMDNLFEAAEPSKGFGHARKHSNDSIESDTCSYKGSDTSNSWAPNLLGEVSLSRAETSRMTGNCGGTESQFQNSAPIVLPMDQHTKLNRVLMIMQRRLVTAKTDMEDLITRLNQEIAVKEYLTTKVKDLELELETTKQKSKENLQQALLLEKERVTKLQWDMEELQRNSMQMELRLKSYQDEKSPVDSTSASSFQGKDELLQELDATKEQLNTLLRQHEELEVKSKSDIKLLVKEVKSLRKAHYELQQQLRQSTTEKSEVERLLQQEKERIEHAMAARRRLMRECEILRSQLQECNSKYIMDDNFITDSSKISNVVDLLTKSDHQIEHLLSEAQNFGKDYITEDNVPDALKEMDDELRKILIDTFVDNAKLRKQVNLFIRSALKKDVASEEDVKGTPREITLDQVSET
ncbi:hypothetical protein Ancab_023176 [Ancistrocladus abbreviatus]